MAMLVLHNLSRLESRDSYTLKSTVDGIQSKNYCYKTKSLEILRQTTQLVW